MIYDIICHITLKYGLSRFKKSFPGLLFEISETSSIPEIDLMSSDGNITSSMVSVMYLFTYIDTKVF